MNIEDYRLIKGETLSIFIVWSDLDDIPIDLQGYSAKFVIYDGQDVELTTIDLPTNENGEIEGVANTDSWGIGVYDYYLRLTSPIGEVIDLTSGKVYLK